MQMIVCNQVNLHFGRYGIVVGHFVRCLYQAYISWGLLTEIHHSLLAKSLLLSRLLSQPGTQLTFQRRICELIIADLLEWIFPRLKMTFLLLRVMDQHKLTKEQWDERITNWWAEHKELHRWALLRKCWDLLNQASERNVTLIYQFYLLDVVCLCVGMMLWWNT